MGFRVCQATIDGVPPQTDGQTERTHQTIEHYLRIHAATENTVGQPSEAEFAYNNAKRETIGVSPFGALYGYNPRMSEAVADLTQTKVQGVLECLRHTRRLRETMRINHVQAAEAQRCYYNQTRYAHLSTRNFHLKAGAKKLGRPILVVTERIGKAAYKVQLSHKYSRLHDVFQVSLLEP